MTYKEIIKMLNEMKLPFAYHHFAEGESPEPPFLVFLYPSSDNFGADGVVYHKISKLDIELYVDRKEPQLEETIEAVLDRHGLFYEKSEIWIASEKLYEVLYEMEV